ncbi:MAG: PKD domain-containing protein [Planctomycetes bacterium]|nr:PKD domain-containing protein [Planctomycetota bacterium]
MPSARPTPPHRRTRRLAPVLAFALVALLGFAGSAATYLRTSLQDLTQNAAAIAEIQVVEKTYAEPPAGEHYPRTHVGMKVLRVLKGELPEQISVDTPGGILGNMGYYVPDGPDFKMGEQAIVFLKQVEGRGWMMQDLGLGKFNLAERDNETYVESALCPQAMQLKGDGSKEDAEAKLLSRAIPYGTFCELVTSYAAGTPAAAVDADKVAAKLAETLGPSQAHGHNAVPAIVQETLAAQQAHEAQAQQRSWFYAGLACVLFALAAAGYVYFRRHRRAKGATVRTLALFLGAMLAAGGGIGWSASQAFVQFPNDTIWDLDNDLPGRVANGEVIWRPSTTTSVTNPNCMTTVQGSFQKWEDIVGSRLAFDFNLGNTTAIATNNPGDSLNVVAWDTTPSGDFSNNTLAICFSSFFLGPPSFFANTDIIFNDEDFSWANTQRVNSVSLHEIGHSIGLDHSTSNSSLMFPFDQNIQDPTADEIAAAQAMYPGDSPASDPVPTAVIDADENFGDPGLVVNFDSSNSSAVNPATIVSTEWNFGDPGSGGSNTSTAAAPSHQFDFLGNFTVSLTVTDSDGLVGTDTFTVTIGDNAQVTKAKFVLPFTKFQSDSIAVTMQSDALIGSKQPQGTPDPIKTGYVTIGGASFPFQYDLIKGKTVQVGGVKIKVNDVTGVLTLKLAKTDLFSLLSPLGAINANILATDNVEVDVPIHVWLGTGSGIFATATGSFDYTATENKKGQGVIVP